MTEWIAFALKRTAAPAVELTEHEQSAKALLSEVFDDRGCRIVNHDGSRVVTPEWVKRVTDCLCGRPSAPEPPAKELYEWLTKCGWVGFQYRTGRIYPNALSGNSCSGAELTEKIKLAMEDQCTEQK